MFKLYLVDDDLYNDEYNLSTIGEDVTLSICMKDRDLIERLQNKEAYKESLKRYIDELRENPILGDNGYSDVIESYMDLFEENWFELVDFVECGFDIEDPLKYLKANPILLTKKIIVGDNIEFGNKEQLVELYNKYKEFENLIYVRMEGNTECISIKTCFKIYEQIEEYANYIKALNLSPMETIMYTYDFVRNRKYKANENEYHIEKSRDLSHVLFEKEIVCVGFANIFSAILNEIGIETSVVYLTNKKNPTSGHARNSIYVVDPKYGIDGFYYFDPTWDSNKNDSDDYLYDYGFFAKTRKEMVELEKDRYIYKDFKEFPSSPDPIIEEYDNSDYRTVIAFMKKYGKFVNFLSKNAIPNNPINYQSIVTKSDKKFAEKLKRGFKKFDRPITAEQFVKLLANVRKIEYYQDPNSYPYGYDELLCTLYNSDFHFKNTTDEEILLLKILKQNEKMRYYFLRFKKLNDKEHFDTEIARVKLVRTLRNISKKNN